MKKVRFFPGALCLFAVPALGASLNQEGRPSPSYHETLKSLVLPAKLKVRPKLQGRDINLIDPEEGAGGVRFGDSIDTVVGVWGKPSGIRISGYSPLWRLRIGACTFSFVNNKLVAISISSATLKDARLESGVTFQSSYDEVKRTVGEPTEETYSTLTFERDNEYVLRFQFMGDSLQGGKRKLIAIEVRHPDYRP